LSYCLCLGPPTKILYAFPISSIRATCPTHLTVLIFAENLQNFLFVNFIPKSLLLPLSEVQIFPSVFSFLWSQDSSVSIVTPYGMDGGGNDVVFLPGTRDFSLLHSVQTGSESHPAFFPIGNGACFPGGKADGGVQLTTQFHLMSRLTIPTPPTSPHVFMALCLTN
jgi:hypothetical protein